MTISNNQALWLQATDHQSRPFAVSQPHGQSSVELSGSDDDEGPSQGPHMINI